MSVSPSAKRIVVWGMCCALVHLALLALASQASARTVDGYWEFANARMAVIEQRWSSEGGAYTLRSGLRDPRLNAVLLELHSIAALEGRDGQVRHDDRARLLVDRLTRLPDPTPGTASAASLSDTDMSVASTEMKLADALAMAWRAGSALGLSATQRAAILATMRRLAGARSRRYPATTLNQWMWAGRFWARYAEVTGDWRLGGTQYRLFLKRFVDGFAKRQPDLKIPNLNMGLGFMYFPDGPMGAWPNSSSSTEYGNIAFSGLAPYETLVAHGMQRLAAADEKKLRQWSERMLAGEWTHSGYLNWDTGLGSLRWHLLRYWGWAMSGLAAHVGQRNLAFDPDESAWAVRIFDRALELHERWEAANGGQLPAYQWDIAGGYSNDPDDDAVLTAARFAVLAGTAALNGFADVTPAEPPSWFAHDPDTRRIAVSTPSYSTSLIKQQAYLTDGNAYGGLELNRLYDANARPLSGVGGNRLAAFGLAVERAGKETFFTQPGALLGFTSSPWTVSVDGVGRLRGRFTKLTASAKASSGFDTVRVVHEFERDRIRTVRVVFVPADREMILSYPIWGTSGARAEFSSGVTSMAPLEGGSSYPVGASVTIRCTSGEGGDYTATITGLPAGATVARKSLVGQWSSPRTRTSVQISFVMPKRVPYLTLREELVPAAAG